MSAEIAKCPCGKTPAHLDVDNYSVKWTTVAGDCCGEWTVEFRSQYLELGPELDALALKAWNGATRGDWCES
jgi:hypothetical protein